MRIATAVTFNGLAAVTGVSHDFVLVAGGGLAGTGVRVALLTACTKTMASAGMATFPSRISSLLTVGPYKAWLPVSSGCTTAPLRLIPAKAPRLRE